MITLLTLFTFSLKGEVHGIRRGVIEMGCSISANDKVEPVEVS